MKELIGKQTGKKYVVQSIDTLMESAETDGTTGYCIFCGSEADGIEPDAGKCECAECGRDGVYGAEELILRGIYHN